MRPSCFGKGKSKVGIMAEKSSNESCHCFLGFCPVLSLPQRFVWRCRGFDWRVLSFLSLLFCLFGVFSVFGHGDNGGLHQDSIAMATIRMRPDHLQFRSPHNPPHTVVLRVATYNFEGMISQVAGRFFGRLAPTHVGMHT